MTEALRVLLVDDHPLVHPQSLDRVGIDEVQLDSWVIAASAVRTSRLVDQSLRSSIQRRDTLPAVPRTA